MVEAPSGSTSVAWFGHRGSDTILLSSLDHGSLRGAFLYGSARGTTADDIASVSLEHVIGRMSVSSEDLERHSEALINIGYAGPGRGPDLIIPFRSTAHLEGWASTVGCAVASTSASIVNRISDRRFLTEHAAAHGVSVPNVAPIPPRANYKSLALQLGSPFIVKGVAGVSGQTCFRVESQGDLASVRAAMRGAPLFGWRIIEGRSLNFHLCIGNDATHIFEPTMQRLDDSDRLRPYRFVGNTFDIPDDLSKQALQGAERELNKLAKVLREAGFRGIAGADVIVTERAQVVVDVNPRFQGSSLPLDLNLAALGLPRLARQHLRACSGVELSVPSFGGHQVRRSVGGQVFVPAPPHMKGRTIYKNGIYSQSAGGLHYEGKLQVGQELAEGHVLILDLPPAPSPLLHGATLARVIHAPGASHDEIVQSVRRVSDGHLRH